MNFYKRLKILIEESGLSQKEFADKFGLGESSISHYLSGNRMPSHEKMLAIAEHFGVSLDWLYGLTDIRNFELPKGHKITINSIIDEMEKTLTDPQSIEIVKQLKEIIKNDPDTGESYFTVFNEAKKTETNPSVLLNFLKILEDAKKNKP